jgi:hypothetical protein
MRRVWFSLLLVAGACGDSGSPSAPQVALRPFDSVDQAQLTSRLTLFGGGGQWTIDLAVTVHNTTTEPRTFAVSPGCPAILYVFTDVQASGAPVWSTLTQKPGCTQTTMIDTIAPGDSLVLRAPTTSTNEILANNGAPNPPGNYFFFSGVRTSLAAGGEVRKLAGFSQLSP